ncbi:NAD(P)-dependent oxidoreductase [Desulfogranum marinum]|uniref:NAD(P)-dependent oxidoreductase n=1 Tax=Desulfogranum marinum TaxID=453220 RepID=UPI001964D135|nr:NAD(P)-dependent oxidoreductase [Desulfogranum marinum]MBM9513697.1 NAD(P)-dependent oxidoreductase [Desulfogranum marinum]
MSSHAIEEAARCLKCKKPLCQQACPVSTNIPEMARLIEAHKIDEAGTMLFDNNPLSVICALICPHENQCEGNCILNRKGEPIHVSTMEHYVSDFYLSRMKNKVPEASIEKNKDKEIAIVGSGPSGLTLAFLMAKKGYPVTIFDNHDKIGGVLRYGIPEFRLPKSIIDRMKVSLKEMGVTIRPNTLIGPNITLDDLFIDGYKAVFVGTGVWKPNRLRIKGETKGHVHFAIDYLKNPEVYDLGSKVVIIGGGNVAMDVARSVLRHGVETSVVLYRKGADQLPALREEIRYTKLDGVQFEFYKSPVEITREGVLYQNTSFSEDKEGNPIFEVDESATYLYEADSIIIAASQGPQANIISSSKGIDTNARGLVQVDRSGQTTREGVYAAGDVVTGAKTVVEAVRWTKETAKAMDDYLMHL